MNRDSSPIVARLRAALGPGRVSTAHDDLEALARDQLRPRRAFRLPEGAPATPLAVVRPASVDDVVATVRSARECSVPLVQYGGGTGLAGGALSLQPGLVLDMRAMAAVRAVYPDDRMVEVEAGATIEAVNAALAPHGHMLGHDPWTVPIATVGGTISTNGLGYLGGKYGGVADQVLGIEAVLGDGTLLRTRAVARSSTGPPLHRLLTGAEGTLGVITAATLRTFPIPERRELIALEFPDFSSGFAAARAMFALGLQPAMLDFGAGMDRPGPFYLAFDGLTEEVAALVERARAICAAHRATETGEEAARRFWATRHVSRARLQGWRQGERSEPEPGTPGGETWDYLHIALPATAVLPYIARAEALALENGVSVHEWGLWHGPELLSTVLSRPTGSPSDLQVAIATADGFLELAQELGGSMEYVHGAGVRLARLMEREHGSGLAVLRSLKRALDPDAVLNPGKLGL